MEKFTTFGAMEGITPERAAKFKRVSEHRQVDLTVILENVHDPHNIGAVLRTCDSVGVHEIFVVHTDPRLKEERIALSKTTASGANKWVDVHYYRNIENCVKHVREKYELILGTHLSQNAKNVYDLDLTRSVALFFGNEKDGLSEDALRHIDGNFIIPQMGMVQSLNISVACAVTLYEAYRQRSLKDMYRENSSISASKKEALMHSYYLRHCNRADVRDVLAKDE